MSDYYVHWNSVVKKVRIHRADCGACKNGAGMHEGRIKAGRGSTYDWVAASSYEVAHELARNLQEKMPSLRKRGAQIDCGLCIPGRRR